MLETLKEGSWTIRMGEGNTVGIIKPLVPFNCIVDTDVGLIQLIKTEYRSPDIFNIGLLDSFINNRGIIKLLYHRKTKNPLLPFMNDQEDVATADDLYKQFMEKEYRNIIIKSVMTGMYKLLYYFTLAEEIAANISYSNPIEEEIINKNKILKKIRAISIKEIPDRAANLDSFFFKDVEDDYFKASLPVLKSKNITFLDYDYNFDEQGTIATTEETAIAEVNRCRFNIINAYNAKELG